MKKQVRFTALILALLLSISCFCGCGATHVERDDWADDVKTAINDFIDLYGNHSKNYSENAYVVSDFDNTASIFDMCKQFMVYQIQVMGFGFTPEELPTILSSGLGDLNKDLSGLGYGNGSYNDWIEDITTAYTYLYTTYGPFTPAGVSDETAAKLQADPMWWEFAAKMLNMYNLIGDNESTDISYPWVTYWYTGMTEDQVYTLARQSHAKYKQVETSEKTIQSPAEIDSKVGVTEYSYIEGIQVTENTKEMWQSFHQSGIDVWVCSASQSDIIRAAIDEFDLHDSCTGLIGMTPTLIDGKLSYTYDYTSGYAWYADSQGEWHKGNVASQAQTQGLGKVTAVQNICVSQYGCGPLAGFMDSTGDYNFCTEFENLKLVICFNRADRKVTDGGSVIAELAIYQREILGYDLQKANAAGDTLYVLQGRDENGQRILRNSNQTLKLGSTEEKLFRDEKNEAVYAYITENQLTTQEIINTFALKTDAAADRNPLGFAYGFLETYAGYHTK